MINLRKGVETLIKEPHLLSLPPFISTMATALTQAGFLAVRLVEKRFFHQYPPGFFQEDRPYVFWFNPVSGGPEKAKELKGKVLSDFEKIGWNILTIVSHQQEGRSAYQLMVQTPNETTMDLGSYLDVHPRKNLFVLETEEWKAERMDVLMQALQALNRDGLEVPLVIVGGGDGTEGEAKITAAVSRAVTLETMLHADPRQVAEKGSKRKPLVWSPPGAGTAGDNAQFTNAPDRYDAPIPELLDRLTLCPKGTAVVEIIRRFEKIDEGGQVREVEVRDLDLLTHRADLGAVAEIIARGERPESKLGAHAGSTMGHVKAFPGVIWDKAVAAIRRGVSRLVNRLRLRRVSEPAQQRVEPFRAVLHFSSRKEPVVLETSDIMLGAIPRAAAGMLYDPTVSVSGHVSVNVLPVTTGAALAPIADGALRGRWRGLVRDIFPEGSFLRPRFWLLPKKLQMVMRPGESMEAFCYELRGENRVSKPMQVGGNDSGEGVGIRVRVLYPDDVPADPESTLGQWTVPEVRAAEGIITGGLYSFAAMEAIRYLTQTQGSFWVSAGMFVLGSFMSLKAATSYLTGAALVPMTWSLMTAVQSIEESLNLGRGSWQSALVHFLGAMTTYAASAGVIKWLARYSWFRDFASGNSLSPLWAKGIALGMTLLMSGLQLLPPSSSDR